MIGNSLGGIGGRLKELSIVDRAKGRLYRSLPIGRSFRYRFDSLCCPDRSYSLIHMVDKLYLLDNMYPNKLYRR